MSICRKFFLFNVGLQGDKSFLNVTGSLTYTIFKDVYLQRLLISAKIYIFDQMKAFRKEILIIAKKTKFK